MKKILFGLILVGLLSGCSKSKKIYDLKEFCDYTVQCYKDNNKSEAINLQITKDEIIAVINTMKMPAANKKKELEGTEQKAANGYFDKTRLKTNYSKIRATQENDFWNNCSIKEYKYMKTTDFFGFKSAEPMVILKYKDNTLKLKVGELIKTANGWKILRGPFLK